MDHEMHHGGQRQVAHGQHAGHDPGVLKRKFWVTLVMTIPILLYSSAVQGFLHFSMPVFYGSEWLPAVLGAVIFVYGGVVFLRGAGNELRDRAPGMMTLISLAITVAFVYSIAVSFGLEGMDFWWELSTLIVIMLLGHWLEMVSVANASGALHELAKLLPDRAEVVVAGSAKIVNVSELKIGDNVLVRPGANVPADGIVIKGESDVNESVITGESRLVKKSPDAMVIGGTTNGSGALTVRVTKLGSDTMLAGIMKLVADAQTSKSRTQILADKAAFYLTIFAVGAAIITAVGWTLIGGESVAFVLQRVVSVLVIACPHALGLAIPLAAAISVAKAAEHGLLVRQRLALESARQVDVVLFDKTGTLTTGRQGVVDVVAVDGKADILLERAAAVEHESEHSVAGAIVEYAQNRRIHSSVASDFVALGGIGAQAKIDGSMFHVGGDRMLQKLNLVLPSALLEVNREAGPQGKTVVYLVDDSYVYGAIVLADVVRQESKEAVRALQSAGKRVAMITGDSDEAAQWVAKELGISEYFSEVLPERKVDMIKKLQSGGAKVMMVGDGVNDAPALVQADVGVAIGAGTNISVEAADIVLINNDPRSVAKIITLSRATYRKMVQNLLWATGYNVVAIPLAAGVLAVTGFVLSPAVGAVLMSLSTVIVAVNAQLLRRAKL